MVKKGRHWAPVAPEVELEQDVLLERAADAAVRAAAKAAAACTAVERGGDTSPAIENGAVNGTRAHRGDDALEAASLTSTAEPQAPRLPAAAPAPAQTSSLGWKAWAALITFVVQNACGGMLVRYTKTYVQEEYSSEVAVLMQEVAVKLPLSLLLFAVECKGPLKMLKALCLDLRRYPKEWLQMTVPAIIYTVQMNLLYVGFENVRAAVGQVTYQSKILFTALMSVLLLKRRLTANQWIALTLLLIGVRERDDRTTRRALFSEAHPARCAKCPPSYMCSLIELLTPIHVFSG